MTKNKSLSESAAIVTNEVEAYLKKARLPVQRKDKIISSSTMRKLFNQWKLCEKKKNKWKGGKQEINQKHGAKA